MRINRIPAVRALGLLLFLAAAALCAGCAEPADLPPVEPAAAQGLEPPAELIKVKEAVLAFLRVGAYECVPAEIAVWQSSVISLPPGYGGYQFSHGSCLMTISYEDSLPEPAAYHASLRNELIGFCWQATVSPGGSILQTGALVELEPGPGNFAASYCQEQGYLYEMREDENGNRCGHCIFDETTACKGWLYFYGECSPGG